MRVMLALRNSAIVLACLITSIAPLIASAESEDQMLAHAKFASGGHQFRPLGVGRQQIGMILHTSVANGTGLSYSRIFQPGRGFWIEGLYGPDQEREGPLVEKSRQWLAVGVDQTIHVTRSRYWGFLVGLGFGYQQREYLERRHPETCVETMCNRDWDVTVSEESADRYAMLSGRFGFALQELQVWGLQGSMTFMVAPELVRWPREFRLRPVDRLSVLLDTGFRIGVAIDF